MGLTQIHLMFYALQAFRSSGSAHEHEYVEARLHQDRVRAVLAAVVYDSVLAQFLPVHGELVIS